MGVLPVVVADEVDEDMVVNDLKALYIRDFACQWKENSPKLYFLEPL